MNGCATASLKISLVMDQIKFGTMTGELLELGEVVGSSNRLAEVHFGLMGKQEVLILRC